MMDYIGVITVRREGFNCSCCTDENIDPNEQSMEVSSNNPDEIQKFAEQFSQDGVIVSLSIYQKCY